MIDEVFLEPVGFVFVVLYFLEASFFFFFFSQFLCEKSRTELRTKFGRQNRRSVLLKDDCNRPETESEARRRDLTESTLNRILC